MGGHLPSETRPDFLRKNGIEPAQIEIQSQLSSDMAPSNYRDHLGALLHSDEPQSMGLE